MGLILPNFARPPDLLIDLRGELVAIADGEGRLYPSRPGARGHGPEVWLRRAGERAFAAPGAWCCDTPGGIVVASTPIPACPGARLILDRFDFWREGPHAIWFDTAGGDRVVSSRDLRGERSWVPACGQ